MAEDHEARAFLEYFKAHLERERPVFNPNLPESLPLKCNPVFRFSAHSSKLICDREDINTHPCATLNQCKGVMNWVHNAVGYLIIGYKSGLVSYASCFRVHHRLYLTSLRNTLPIPTYQGDLEPIRYWWAPSIKVPYCLSDAIRKEEEFKEEGIIPLTLVARDANFHNLIPDVDPRSKKALRHPSDFAFLSTTWSQYDNMPFFTPSPMPPCSGDHIAVMGYHKPYPDPLWLRELFDPRMPDFNINPSPVDLASHFHGFGIKSVSPGSILPPGISGEGITEEGEEMNAYHCVVGTFDEMGGLRVVIYDASVFVGASGAAVVPLPIGDLCFSFLGIHSGSWTIGDLCTNPKDVAEGVVPDCTVLPNYNMATSVHHPHFVAEYVTKVVPLFAGNIPNTVKHYLHMHRKTLEELGIFPHI